MKKYAIVVLYDLFPYRLVFLGATKGMQGAAVIHGVGVWNKQSVVGWLSMKDGKALKIELDKAKADYEKSHSFLAWFCLRSPPR